MTDRPILFSAPMVQALLAGRKTQTRRLASSPLQRVRPGDQLWVRETWKSVPASAYRCSEGVHQTLNPGDPDTAAIYRVGWDRSTGGTPWRVSIHMPRWASRLTLTVTDVRAQRLQEISEADAMAEGAAPILVPPDGGSAPHVEGFRKLWNSLHGPDAWAANPEVVALTFTVAHRNIDAKEPQA